MTERASGPATPYDGGCAICGEASCQGHVKDAGRAVAECECCGLPAGTPYFDNGVINDCEVCIQPMRAERPSAQKGGGK